MRADFPGIQNVSFTITMRHTVPPPSLRVSLTTRSECANVAMLSTHANPRGLGLKGHVLVERLYSFLGDFVVE